MEGDAHAGLATVAPSTFTVMPDVRPDGALLPALNIDTTHLTDAFVGMLRYTVKHVLALADDLEAVGIDLSTVKLRALLNESVVERVFGHQPIMTQADHPTQREYAASKPKADRSTLNQLATPAFSLFTSLWNQYVAPHVSSVSATQLYRLMAKLHSVVWPLPAEPSAAEKAALQADLVVLRQLAELAGQQRCANTRAKYKRPCGVNPTVFVNTQAEWAAENAETNLLTSFTEEVARLTQKRNDGAGHCGANPHWRQPLAR